MSKTEMTADLRQRYSGKRVLITGASGFLGKHLIARLVSYDCNIIGVSRSCREYDYDNVLWHQADMTDSVKTTHLFKEFKPDIVFHLTSESRGSTSLDNVLPCFKNDLEAAVNCLMAASQIVPLPRFVMTGSLEEPKLPQDRDDADPLPSTPYAAAKFSGVLYGKMFYRLYKLPVVVLRPFVTYGPGQKEYKVIPYTILSLLNDRPPRISSGDRSLDLIYISDVVEAFVRAGIATNAPGETLELGSAELIALREVVKKIHCFVGGPDPIFDNISGWGENDRRAGTYNTFLVLGWRPRVALDEGLHQTIEWYRLKRNSAEASSY
jgi:nucleoside-diphosphate-sugar epimerase